MKKKLSLILILVLIVFNAGMTYAYWASSVSGNQDQSTGQVPIGQWVPPGFFGVAQSQGNGNITLSQIGTSGYPLGGNYILVENINLGGGNFTPIANGSTFTGKFLGNGFTISNFTLVSNAQNVGFFSALGSSAVIDGLYLLGVSANLTGSSERRLGTIAGQNAGTIMNSYATGTLTANLSVSGSNTIQSFVGGLSGYNTGTIINSAAVVGVTSTTSASASWFQSATARSYAGGITGFNNATLERVYASGSVSASATATNSGWFSSSNREAYAGGVIGQNAGSISSSFAAGNVSSTVNTGSNNRAGRVIASGSGTNLHRLSTQTISGNIHSDGAVSRTLANLTSQSWLETNLGMSTSDWSFPPSAYPLPIPQDGW